jgi:hypothetical protein
MEENQALRYGPFKTLDMVGNNAYRLVIPPCMCIYAIVNVDNHKLYDSSMLNEDEEGQVLSFIEYLEPDA